MDSELLLEILGPGIVGGLFLPVLGALPDAMLILVSGLSGSISEAQSQVSVGMGLLAGSTVMLLTLIWGTCIFVGKCDLDRSMAVDETNTKGFHLLGSGVSTDIWTSYAARIMAISVFPFLVVQLPQALNSTSGRHLAVLIGLVFSAIMLVCYCLYQLYGAVTMNNVLCLSVFLALVYLRGLTWDFSSEMLVIFVVCIIMGCLGSFRTTFPLWTAFVAFALYPFSLFLVYLLDYVFGWS